MQTFGLSNNIVDEHVRQRAIAQLKKRGIVLPKLAELADPERIASDLTAKLEAVDPDAADPLNLFRVHWFNGATRRGRAPIPQHLVLGPEVTGVAAPIVVALGNRFPMIGAHKVLAAYGCLAPRLVTGQFDPESQRAVWPSTGNYCRGGVAISRIMACRGVAVLPEGMSHERFRWLESWVADPKDIIKTPGSESNVKEIYDCCNALAKDPQNVVLNQFAELGNHLVHYSCTGRAMQQIFESLHEERPELELFGFVSATGSAGTIAAGDYLKDQYDSHTVAVEALECPTLLYNGFGAHNIQGIGDKHLPLIHNVLATDIVTAVSDQATDQLLVLFNTPAGRRYLEERRGVPRATVLALSSLGISGICNIVAAIKVARHLQLGPEQLLLTVATDGAEMYKSELDKVVARDFSRGVAEVDCGETYGRFILGAAGDHTRELDNTERQRLFNLGYFTWVEQQGVALEDFEARRAPSFWRGLHTYLGAWDELIDAFNQEAAKA